MTPTTQELEKAVLGRCESFFAKPYADALPHIQERATGTNILIIGAAGSIGSATTLELLKQVAPDTVTLVDKDENRLVDLMREINLTCNTFRREIHVVPVCCDAMTYIRDTRPTFDYCLNFAAVKHLRTASHNLSIQHMWRTNVLLPYYLERNKTAHHLFSVSTDKAVNPKSYMGASKHVMEMVLSDGYTCSTSSARFANVAFSQGSILDNVVKRYHKRQLIVIPNGVKRYFISHLEAAQLCLMACFCYDEGKVLVPNGLKPMDVHSAIQIAASQFGPLSAIPENSSQEFVSTVYNLRKKVPVCEVPASGSGEKLLEEGMEPIDSTERVYWAPMQQGDPDKLLRLLRDTDRRFDSHRLYRELLTLINGFSLNQGTPLDSGV